MRRYWLFLAIGLTLTASSVAAGLPKRVGRCSLTRVSKVETRLMDGVTNEPILGSGSVISFANGGHQVSSPDDKQDIDVYRSRPGDLVKLCLVSIPRGCPPGDVRGRVYKTKNFRTRNSWTLPDDEHSCGGA
jgi:hypothetical protein